MGTNGFGADNFAQGREAVALVLAEGLLRDGALDDFCFQRWVQIDLRKVIPVL